MIYFIWIFLIKFTDDKIVSKLYVCAILSWKVTIQPFFFAVRMVEWLITYQITEYEHRSKA